MKYYLLDKNGKESILDTTNEELNGCIVGGHRFGFDTDEILVKQNGEKFGITKIEKEYIGKMTLQEIVDSCIVDYEKCKVCEFREICENIYLAPKDWNLYI